jgi:hypothetical protein
MTVKTALSYPENVDGTFLRNLVTIYGVASQKTVVLFNMYDIGA